MLLYVENYILSSQQIINNAPNITINACREVIESLIENNELETA